MRYGARAGIKLPQIFRVNWFRKNADGKFAWPGYGQNMRVLQWIVDRVHGHADAAESPFGLMPRYEDLNWKGLDFSKEQFLGIMDIVRDGVIEEAAAIDEYFGKFGNHLPPELEVERKKLQKRAESAPETWSLGG